MLIYDDIEEEEEEEEEKENKLMKYDLKKKTITCRHTYTQA